MSLVEFNVVEYLINEKDEVHTTVFRYRLVKENNGFLSCHRCVDNSPIHNSDHKLNGKTYFK